MDMSQVSEKILFWDVIITNKIPSIMGSDKSHLDILPKDL
jgi:hypothetical protein